MNLSFSFLCPKHNPHLKKQRRPMLSNVGAQSRKAQQPYDRSDGSCFFSSCQQFHKYRPTNWNTRAVARQGCVKSSLGMMAWWVEVESSLNWRGILIICSSSFEKNRDICVRANLTNTYYSEPFPKSCISINLKVLRVLLGCRGVSSSKTNHWRVSE